MHTITELCRTALFLKPHQLQRYRRGYGKCPTRSKRTHYLMTLYHIHARVEFSTCSLFPCEAFWSWQSSGCDKYQSSTEYWWVTICPCICCNFDINMYIRNTRFHSFFLSLSLSLSLLSLHLLYLYTYTLPSFHRQLCVGVPQTFTVTVTPLRNLPLDLYVLIDLSPSMMDDLDSLKTLAGDIGIIILD